ncbi:hypothetical protein, partial [Sedimenticola sp.]|uniref:hypothetical protein n=1 Tax=Sedimenticola sp. TaxID=1940285 RepID=UPI003D0A5B7D
KPDLKLLFEQPVHPMAQPLVRASISRPVDYPTDPSGPVLRDAFNPLDVQEVWIKEAVRLNILRDTNWDILGAVL